MTRHLIVALLVLGVAELALADPKRVFVVEREVQTPGDEAVRSEWRSLKTALDQNQARLVDRRLPTPEDERKIFTLVYLADAPGAGPLVDAKEVDPRATRVTLVVQARDRGTGRSVGVPVIVESTLQEVDRLRRGPQRMRNTVAAALLRRAWAEAHSGRKDDVEAVEVRITPVIQVQLMDGRQGPSFPGAVFDSDAADLLLGRMRTVEERIRAAQSGEAPPPLRSLSDDLARRMEQGLVRARLLHPDDGAVWSSLNDLRNGKPRPFDTKDKAFIHTLTGRGASEQRQASHKPPLGDAQGARGRLKVVP